MSEVVIIETAVANTASVKSAFSRLGVRSRSAKSAMDIEQAAAVVLPGVGSFGACRDALRPNNIDDAICERVMADKPTLAICAGFQVLFEKSEEDPQTAGLGILSGSFVRFPDSVRVPQFGWNRVQANSDCSYVSDGYAYFANSYFTSTAEAGWLRAESEHGERFLSAVERGALLGCQFHPELSGPWGEELLRRWAKRGGVLC